MQDYQTWRMLLSDLIKHPRERKRIARAIGVETAELRSWSNNTSSPSVQQLRNLLRALSHRQLLLRTLIAEEFDEFDVELVDIPSYTTPITFAAHLLALVNNVPDESRCWSICTAILTETVKQLDPDRSGISLSIVHCVPSQAGKIAYLRDYIGLGTPPWLDQVEMRTRFLGSESLAGEAITSGLPQIIADIHQQQCPVINIPEHAVSVAAFPITHSNRIAGCFLIASTQANFFASHHKQKIIQNYQAMLPLAFSPDMFYGQEQIALQIMPTFQVQQPYLSTSQQRIIATLKTAFSAKRSINYLEAQQHVNRQIAEELLKLRTQPGF